jgi:hypothetical protein
MRTITQNTPISEYMSGAQLINAHKRQLHWIRERKNKIRKALSKI